MVTEDKNFIQKNGTQEAFLASLGQGVRFSRFWRGFIFALPLKICLELGKSQRWKSLYVLLYETRETESGYRDRGRETMR